MLESSVPERGSKKPKKEPVTETQEEATGFLGGLLSSVKEKFSSGKASSSKPAAAKARAVFSSPQGAAKSVAAPSQKLAKAGTDGATSRGASPVPSMASMASALDNTRGIGLSAYFSGTRETYGRLITRIQGSIGAMNLSVEGEGLDGFPSKNAIKKLLGGLAREGGLESLSDDEVSTLSQMGTYFQNAEREYNDSTKRRTEESANKKFSMAFLIAGQVARRQLQYAPENKDQNRVGGGLWFFVTAPKPRSCLALSPAEVAACYNKLNELGLTSDVRAGNLPAPVMSYLNKQDKPYIDRESSLLVHRVAALTLREGVEEFTTLIDGACVSQGLRRPAWRNSYVLPT